MVHVHLLELQAFHIVFPVLLICQCLWQVTSASQIHIFPDRRQEEFVRSLEQYEVAIPERVTRSGDHLSHTLHPHHVIEKRNSGSGEGASERANYLHYKIHVDNKDVILSVRQNDRLVAPGFVVERRQYKFKNVTDSTFLFPDIKGCHYIGDILGDAASRVAVGTCNGLTGLIHTGDTEYFIEPIKGHDSKSDPRHPHIVYKRSALPSRLDFTSTEHHEHRDERSCGVKDDDNEFLQRERWEQHSDRRKREAGHTRTRRSISTEKHVETLVVVDPRMVEHYKNEDIETYVLTIMNMVANLFHDATIGNAINIVLVRIILLEQHQEDLVITHHADKTLTSFCKWAKKMNFKDDDHPNHHDVAILLTRHNICSRMNEPCATLGLAHVAGMCQPHRSCNINEDTGLALAYTVAHELGHNVGMKHDSVHNKCEAQEGEQYVMAPHLIADSGPMIWSNCSQKSITKFLDRDWGYCLDDAPGNHDFKFPVLPPGTMYDADHQCRLQYGHDAALCDGIENLCSTMWCRVNNRCSTKLEAAAEGTICGSNRWCFMGKCVEIGERPQAINGEWGEWNGWTECTRSCGAGISHSERHCDNPPPSNGGHYCIGERKRYRICNTDTCPEKSPSFHQLQCSEFNYIPYKNGLYEWEPVPTPNTPCQLHCKPSSKFFSVMLKDMVTDGTPCTPGMRNMCITGRCRHVGCDWAIDSSAKEDRCGVCHGDGSTCKTIKDQYNETQGLGYVEATVIPSGARNIRVEEVAAANNYLALRGNNGDYFLNGNWFIQWSGDYEVAGTVVHYRRQRDKDSFNAIGPLKEPLHIMLLLQSQNPGVVFEYTVPKENISEARKPVFLWEFSDWTHCTASCGGGNQRSQVICVEIEAGPVEDFYCNATTKPDDNARPCNDHLCPARWWTGPWQHCSVTCGDTGVHRRTVICVRSLGPDEQIALEDQACEGQEKPTEQEACRRKDPCPGTSKWIVGEWSSCNGNPCSKQYRTVMCEDPNVGCDELIRPEAEDSCSNITCGVWTTEEWSPCTRTCGGGVQYRKVTCEGGPSCNAQEEPESETTCRSHACPPETTMEASTSVLSTEVEPDLIQTTFVTNLTKDFTDNGTLTPESTVSEISSDASEMLTNNTSVDVITDSVFSTVDTNVKDYQQVLNEEHNTTERLDEQTIAQDVDLTPVHVTEAEHSLEDNRENPDSFENTVNSSSSMNYVKVIEQSLSKQPENDDTESNVQIQEDGQILKLKADITTVSAQNGLHKHRHQHNHRQEENTGQKSTEMPLTGNAEQIVTIPQPSPTTDTRATVILSDNEGDSDLENKDEIYDDHSDTEHNGSLTTAHHDPRLQTAAPPVAKYKWHPEKFSKCSRHCGGGIKHRSVSCIDVLSGVTVLDSNCDIALKPNAIEKCNKDTCLDWKITNWTGCSATCGHGLQRRHVYCPYTHMCDSDNKPDHIRKCEDLPPCIKWVYGQWSHCSATCAGGEQVRLVQCVNLTSQHSAQGCSAVTKPSEKQDCNVDKCPEQKSAALTTNCESNEMSYQVCRALRRMDQCSKRFVKLKCCKTCGMDQWRLYRPAGKSLR